MENHFNFNSELLPDVKQQIKLLQKLFKLETKLSELNWFGKIFLQEITKYKIYKVSCAIGDIQRKRENEGRGMLTLQTLFDTYVRKEENDGIN
jgi:hypothetical protein